jgi:acyl-CoA synthetase (AMP-forming)/AMP-acid ligase II
MKDRMQISKELVVGELIARWARRTPDKEILVFENKRVTYKEIDNRINRMANVLLKQGIKKGDKVSLLFFNAIEQVESYFAIAKIGAVSVPLNFRLVGEELVYQIDQSDSKVLIFGKVFEEIVESIRKDLPKVSHYILVDQANKDKTLDYNKLLSSGSEEEPHIFIKDDDPAFIIYTSGTTGKPKGAVLTHKNLLMNSLNLTAEISFSGNVRSFCIPPLFHMAALGLFLTVVLKGGTTVIAEQFVPEEIPKILVDEKISFMFLVPVMWIFLINVPGIKEYDFSELTSGFSGAAIMPVEVKKQIMEIFPGMALYDVFGQTEMSPCTTMLKHADSLRKQGSVGQRILNVESRIVNQKGDDVKIGEVGEIVYRGPTVLKEYYKNPEATKEAMAGGWFHSGDLVKEDEEGYIYVVDRAKDMIISGGENVYAAEVEEVIFTCPKVLEVAVIGVPDAKWGESVKAIVVSKPELNLTEDDIINHCKDKLASYKKPKSVEIIDALPRNATGKVMKFKLRENFK